MGIKFDGCHRLNLRFFAELKTEVDSNFAIEATEAVKNKTKKILHLGPKFLCLMFSEPSAPLRIPLGGPPMILFSAVCICWFDNPVILPSEGDSGSTNTQQRGELLDCDGAHCSSQTMSSL